MTVRARSAPKSSCEYSGLGTYPNMVNLRSRGDVIDVVAQGHEEIEEELGAAVEHFQLHGAAALESAAGANDESEVMSPKLGVIVGSVGIGISS